jgi:hypothetical protein
MTVDRIEQLIAVGAGLLIVAGTALIYPPVAFIVAGCLLLASVIDLPRRRPKP